MTIEFNANASDLHRACLRLAARLSEMPGADEKPINFKVTLTRLGMTVDKNSAKIMVEAQRAGYASIPFTILAGLVHVLPYFGSTNVEIGFSPGRVRVDTTVFHSRSILVSSSSGTERRRSSSRERTLQLV